MTRIGIPSAVGGGADATKLPLTGGTLTGALALPSRTVTATAVLTASDSHVYLDATAGAFTLTLPAPVAGRAIVLERIDASANVVTIAGAATALTMSAGHGKTLTSDGTAWYLAGRAEPNGTYVPNSWAVGIQNFAAGVGALGAATGAAQNNVAIGPGAMQLGTAPFQSDAIGFQTLRNATGGPNTAIGYSALTAVTSGDHNVAIGLGALRSVTTAQSNVAIGVYAGDAITGTGNTAIGMNAGWTFLGVTSGTTITNSTCIGQNAQAFASNVVVLGSSYPSQRTSLCLGNSGDQLGGGVGVIALSNAATSPTTNPAGGGVMYAEAGAGKWRGSSGTVTTFGPAEPHCPDCGRDFALEWESERYGYLSLCMWCVTEGMTKGVMARRAA